MRTFGALFVVIGIIISAAAFAWPVAAPGSTIINLDATLRLMLLICGASTAVTGWIVIALGDVLAAMKEYAKAMDERLDKISRQLATPLDASETLAPSKMLPPTQPAIEARPAFPAGVLHQSDGDLH
jgi:hypothetical protein